MMTTQYANVNVRMDKEVKAQAESMFSSLGLNMSTAVNMFVRQCLIQHKLPFELATEYHNTKPLPLTEYSKPFNNLDDLWEDLEI